ncbi:hypothetical protein [Sphingobacterium pedocola]|uniref:Uncharacterized protein n=1 Tax=Sphingobacterium pedocola TaxID=2082722 RepID=A0ABR9T3T0_9SPHI|nr:hypothetical protein [Sphingobacterium pedocola]MBE8719704.1 hypothetical protein [Sphingobacterium pedocola]
MKNSYRTDLAVKLILFITAFFFSANAYRQSDIETFDGSNSTRVPSLNRTVGGVQFNFLVTPDGSGGDFVLFPKYGLSNSPSLALNYIIFLFGVFPSRDG